MSSGSMRVHLEGNMSTVPTENFTKAIHDVKCFRGHSTQVIQNYRTWKCTDYEMNHSVAKDCP